MITALKKINYLNNSSIFNEKVCDRYGCTCLCECKDCEKFSNYGGD